MGRYLEPYPLFVSHAKGPRKWDVDGNEYVDYFGGHGALLLGHCHPEVNAAVARQVERGAHFGASHELEVEWAELIREMVPSAGKVRFTSSGTEATHLAMRLARAYTGKPKVVRFLSHFHGWHDHVAFGEQGGPGILPGITEGAILCRPHDVEQVREVCASRSDVAAIILEPTGATFGQVPCSGDVLRQLREIATAAGVLLIFDEVISGFRVSPGGAQAHYGVTPDMTTLAKILAGGYPGAAVAGRADVFEPLNYRGEGESLLGPRVPHQGTFNASPVSAAAGIATLRILRDTDAVEKANRTAETIRAALNEVCRRKGSPWCVYGEFSAFHIFTGGATPEDIYAGKVPYTALKGGTPLALTQRIRSGFLAEGVDLTGWPGGLVSSAHGEAEVEATVKALEAVIDAVG